VTFEDLMAEAPEELLGLRERLAEADERTLYIKLADPKDCCPLEVKLSDDGDALIAKDCADDFRIILL
jgi:hypothetical protein